VRRTRATRCGTTASTRRASASNAPPMRTSSAQRVRKHWPGIRGSTSLTPHSSRTGGQTTWATLGARTPPGGVPLSGGLSAPASRTPACRHWPISLRRLPSLPRCGRHARRSLQARLSTPPLTSASTRPWLGPSRHCSRRSGRACGGRWPCLTPWEKAWTSCPTLASRSSPTARWTLLSAQPGGPRGRCFPPSCSSPTRSTGGATYRWARRRSCRARRLSATFSASGGAGTWSIPGARLVWGWGEASRTHSQSSTCPPLWHPRAGGSLACGALLWRFLETVGEPGVSSRGPASKKRAPRRCLPSRGARGPRFPTVLGTLRRSDSPRPVSGRFAARSLPDPGPASCRSWCPWRAQALRDAPRTRQGLGSPGPPCRAWCAEPGGAPTFPRFPGADLPRAQPPGVSCARASLAHRMGACRRLQPVGFGLQVPAASLRTTTLPIAGRNDAAGLLAPSSSGLPLLGWHVEGATAVLARRASGGNGTEHTHPLGNHNPCHESTLNAKVSGLPWREHAVVRLTAHEIISLRYLSVTHIPHPCTLNRGIFHPECSDRCPTSSLPSLGRVTPGFLTACFFASSRVQ
jgi:hypothetical protein